MPTDTRRTWCGLCHARCGLLMDFDGERAVAVRGDPDHPTNLGRTCARGRMMVEHLYHPDRLDHPLRRVGARGAGQWERVSWDEALGEVAARLAALRDQHGPETLAMSRGTWLTYHWDARRFMNHFGSPNITGANPICHCNSLIVDTLIMGAMPHPDLARSQCVVIWGSARSQSAQVTEWHDIQAAKKRGARVITVDPRRTREADLAELWLPIRPGTDAALMLGWLHVICAEGLWDRTFVDEWTLGFDDVQALVQDFPPVEVSHLTGVPEADIVEAARRYATTRPAVITWGQGVDKIGPNAEAALHARAILRAVTGNLDVPGGECFGGSSRPMQVVSSLALEQNDALPAAQRAKQLGGARHPLFSFATWDRLADNLARLPADYLRSPPTGEVVTAHPFDTYNAMRTGEPYPVRPLIVQAANPLLTLADPTRIFEALHALDLLVIMDYYLTPTAALADFVFPAAATVERDDLTVFGSGVVAHPRALALPLPQKQD